MERKLNRLKNFDYATNVAYFITICTDKRKNLFWNKNIVGDDAHIVSDNLLSNYGKTVKQYIENMVGVEKYVIMPNHIHLIVRVGGSDGTMWASSPTQSVSQIIKSFKILVSKKIGCSIWQRSFYDRIIRNDDEYMKICDYINKNPYNWQSDEYYFLEEVVL